MSLAACGGQYPNSTFLHWSEFASDIDFLWDRLLLWGTIVFVLVEAVLIYTIFRFRARPGAAEPKQTHGNTTLEITWTVIPAIILVFIAIPTIRTVFKTQAKAPAGAIEVEVIGHQWWWEFRYPQYGVVTANELYLPAGRTASFALKTKDVLHSFWIPNFGGKRDLISNRTNYLWFTPNDTITAVASNGQCAEYCGDSHANMKFRVYVVKAADFESWAAHQKGEAVFGVAPVAAPAPAAAPGKAPARKGAASGEVALADTTPAAAPTGYVFPADKLPAHVIPQTPLPAGLALDDATLAKGNADSGKAIYSRSTCIGCHAISGNPMSMGIIGPNLTHLASRHTMAAGLYPNDAKHLSAWIKNARAMKPGSLMPTLGMEMWDPMMKMKVTTGGLTDAQIADVVAYLRALK
ncbi:MAG: cytochrome c oxidase subunit II [Gemmatimonadetes bacterium]|nr:cytochrome c oxidase subunit II [Gemmatimonadota bacterium]